MTNETKLTAREMYQQTGLSQDSELRTRTLTLMQKYANQETKVLQAEIEALKAKISKTNQL